MDTSLMALHHGLTFLAYATGIILVIVSGFLLKLIIDLSRLTKNVDDTTTIIKTEIKPTIKELNTSLHSINEFMQSTDKGLDKVRNTFEDALGLSATALSKVRVMSGSLAKGLFKGFTTIVKLFSK